MESRRIFLQTAVFGLAASRLGVAHAAPAAFSVAAPVAGGAPWWLFAPLQAGSPIGLGWRLARVFPAQDGAVTLNLLHDDGRVARVDVCLREAAARGPASTDLLDFIVMDGGDGQAALDESLGRAVRRLAAFAAENESPGAEHLAVLQPHEDRLWRHADALGAAAQQLHPGVPAVRGA